MLKMLELTQKWGALRLRSSESKRWTWCCWSRGKKALPNNQSLLILSRALRKRNNNRVRNKQLNRKPYTIRRHFQQTPIRCKISLSNKQSERRSSHKRIINFKRWINTKRILKIGMKLTKYFQVWTFSKTISLEKMEWSLKRIAMFCLESCHKKGCKESNRVLKSRLTMALKIEKRKNKDEVISNKQLS